MIKVIWKIDKWIIVRKFEVSLHPWNYLVRCWYFCWLCYKTRNLVSDLIFGAFFLFLINFILLFGLFKIFFVVDVCKISRKVLAVVCCHSIVSWLILWLQLSKQKIKMLESAYFYSKFPIYLGWEYYNIDIFDCLLNWWFI